MNIKENLIFIRTKENAYQDKTESIIDCNYKDSKYEIKFSNEKTYKYNECNVKWFKNPIILDCEKVIIYEENQPINGVLEVFKFQEHIRICFKNGYKKVYQLKDVVIEEVSFENTYSGSCLEYLKRLSKNISNEIDNENSFIGKQYEKLSKVNPRSVLDTYLNTNAIKERDYEEQVIFPFGFNISQEEATIKSLASEISVIEGPPGTGKTQTILNIIANAIIHNKTVAVVSNNNSATANVAEKLEKYGVGFISAYLGNKSNKDKFFEEQSDTYPDMNGWVIDSEELKQVKENLVKCKKNLDEMLNNENNRAKLKQLSSELAIEKEYFNMYWKEIDQKEVGYKSLYKYNSTNIMRFLVDYEIAIKTYGSVPLKGKIINLIRYGIINFKYYNNSSEVIVDNLKRLYYELKHKELDTEIESLDKILERFRFDYEMKKYSDDSMVILKDTLGKRFGNRKTRKTFTDNYVWKNFDDFLGEYPVILSTTHSLRTCAKENYLFDYLIVDEASQVDIVTGALAFSCAKNAIVVGDLKQLPNIVTTEVEKKTKLIFKDFNINKAYSYWDNSLLSSIIKLYPEIPKTLLKEHYRCHPKIIGFCNKKFYNDELVILTSSKENDKPLEVYKAVEGNHARGKLNQRQIDIVNNEIIPKLDKEKLLKSVGIISPYRLQSYELRKTMINENIEIDTVHKYQGREKEIVILTTVANEINDFIDNPNLINVAISRAQNKLILIVNSGIDDKDSNIRDLIKYIDYNNFEIINSKIYSVFDLLYKSYSKRLDDIMKKSKKVSEFASENLMNIIIEKVLNNDKFKSLDVVLHQPLKMLIKDTSKLTKEEYKFAMNVLTHTDFMIFNKLDKIPVLVVEVDGYENHNSETQIRRDKMKDEILSKYGITILRVKTNGSGEEMKLHKKLLEVVDVKKDI